MAFVDQFQRAIEAAGLPPPEVIQGDGQLRSYNTNGKRGINRACSYCTMMEIWLLVPSVAGALASSRPGAARR